MSQWPPVGVLGTWDWGMAGCRAEPPWAELTGLLLCTHRHNTFTGITRHRSQGCHARLYGAGRRQSHVDVWWPACDVWVGWPGKLPLPCRATAVCTLHDQPCAAWPALPWPALSHVVGGVHWTCTMQVHAARPHHAWAPCADRAVRLCRFAASVAPCGAVKPGDRNGRPALSLACASLG